MAMTLTTKRFVLISTFNEYDGAPLDGFAQFAGEPSSDKAAGFYIVALGPLGSARYPMVAIPLTAEDHNTLIVLAASGKDDDFDQRRVLANATEFYLFDFMPPIGEYMTVYHNAGPVPTDWLPIIEPPVIY